MDRLCASLKLLEPCRNHVNTRMSQQKFQLQTQSVGVRNIISVHPGNPLPPRQPYASVQGRGDTIVALPDVSETPVLFHERADNGRRFISRAIIDNNDLKVSPGLIANGNQRRTKIRRGVISRQND